MREIYGPVDPVDFRFPPQRTIFESQKPFVAPIQFFAKKDFTPENHRKETDALKRSLNESELEGLVKGLLSAPVTVPTKFGKFLIKTALDALREKKSGQ